MSAAGNLEKGRRIAQALQDRAFAVLPTDYLREIENARFPLEETDPAKVRCVELLRAVSYLDATVSTDAHEGQRAHVKRITWMGRTALENGQP